MEEWRHGRCRRQGLCQRLGAGVDGGSSAWGLVALTASRGRPMNVGSGRGIWLPLTARVGGLRSHKESSTGLLQSVRSGGWNGYENLKKPEILGAV